jgi:hypothetical protein
MQRFTADAADEMRTAEPCIGSDIVSMSLLNNRLNTTFQVVSILKGYASRIRNVLELCRYSNSLVSEYRLESLRYDFINNFLGSLFVIQKRKICIRFG